MLRLSKTNPHNDKALSAFIKSNILQADTLEEIVRIMELVVEEQLDENQITMKSGLTSVSKWDWKKICREFKLPRTPPRWAPKTCIVPDNIIKWTVDAYNMIASSQRREETRQNLFIQMLISRIAYQFAGKMFIEDQPLAVSGGCTEFVIYAEEEVLAIVIIENNSVLDKSSNQLFLEMHAADKRSMVAGSTIRSLRGAVSNAHTWSFFEYSRKVDPSGRAEESLNGDESKESEDEDESEDDEAEHTESFVYTFQQSGLCLGLREEHITDVCSKVYWMLLQGWCDVQAQYVAVWQSKVAALEPKKHEKRNRVEYNNVTRESEAAKKRHENAALVLQAALAAKDGSAAEAALKLLTDTFTDTSYYP